MAQESRMLEQFLEPDLETFLLETPDQLTHAENVAAQAEERWVELEGRPGRLRVFVGEDVLPGFVEDVWVNEELGDTSAVEVGGEEVLFCWSGEVVDDLAG